MKTLQQYMFDAERFGLTPKKIWTRLSGKTKTAPRILSITMPKSGTALLQRILVLHPVLSRAWLPTLGRRNLEIWADARKLFTPIKPGKIISSHFDYDVQLADLMRNELSYKMLLMVRDPRDAVISDMHYIQTWPGHPLKDQVKAMGDDKTRLMALIQGRDGIRNIRDQVLRFAEWTRYAHTVRFEDAVGKGGGGSDETQLACVQGIFDYLGIPMSESEAQWIATNARSGKTQTFRTGRIRNWEKVYDDELKDAFRAVAGDLLIDLGYETGMEW